MPDIFLESLKASGQLALPMLQRREPTAPEWPSMAEFGWAKVRLPLGARARGQGASFLGRTLPKETTWQGTVISGGDSNRKGTRKPRVVVRTLS